MRVSVPDESSGAAGEEVICAHGVMFVEAEQTARYVWLNNVSTSNVEQKTFMTGLSVARQKNGVNTEVPHARAFPKSLGRT